MCECIRKQVLEGVVLSKLSLSSEAELVIGLTLLTQSLRIVTYKRLIQGIKKREKLTYFKYYHYRNYPVHTDQCYGSVSSVL